MFFLFGLYFPILRKINGYVYPTLKHIHAFLLKSLNEKKLLNTVSLYVFFFLYVHCPFPQNYIFNQSQGILYQVVFFS